MNGIEREVDSLGRVVIPIKFRKKLGIDNNSVVLISYEDDVIIISPKNKCCALCGKSIDAQQKFRLCKSCISEIKSDI